MLGTAPELFRGWLDFAWPLRLNAKTPRLLRELMILRGAQLSGTAYEWAHHLPMATEAGVSEAQIDALANWRDSDLFDADARAVLQLAEEVTRGPRPRRPPWRSSGRAASTTRPWSNWC